MEDLFGDPVELNIHRPPLPQDDKRSPAYNAWWRAITEQYAELSVANHERLRRQRAEHAGLLTAEPALTADDLYDPTDD